MSQKTGHVVAIMGATATGKTEVAIRMAEAFDGEIVSMDSRQVYRRLDIGTAKPTPEDRRRIPHHLVDMFDPTDTTSAGGHLRLVDHTLRDVFGRRKMAFLVGGTGLYFRAFFFGLVDIDIPADRQRSLREEMDTKATGELYEELRRVDPERASELSQNDRMRITRALEVYRWTGKTLSAHMHEQAMSTAENQAPRELRIVLTRPRAALRDRIADRTRQMFQAGWVEEVAALIGEGYTLETPAMSSLGYASIAEAILSGDDPYKTLNRITTVTQQYAKRQETFFRSVPHAHWFDMDAAGSLDKIKQLIAQWAVL